MKKGGIPTFLSAQTIDDSDRGTCWHVDREKLEKLMSQSDANPIILSQISPGRKTKSLLAAPTIVVGWHDGRLLD